MRGSAGDVGDRAGRGGKADRDLLRPLWHALVVFRPLAYVFALVVVLRRNTAPSLLPATIVLGAMAVWTVLMTLALTRARFRRIRTMVADLVVTLACMCGCLAVYGPSAVRAGAGMVTGVWAAGPVIGLGLAAGVRGGLVGAVVLAAGTLALRRRLDAGELNSIALLLLSGSLVGYASSSTGEAMRRVRAATAAAGAAAERERLSRDVHDEVLQVLAKVHRQASAPGADHGELGELAADAESSLRRLMTDPTVPATPLVAGATVDLGAALAALGTRTVEVVRPVGPIEVDAGLARELAAVAGEAVANTARHAGSGARAWVVVEDLGDEVGLVVRDDGVGTSAEVVEAAAGRGRLGVAQSIRGRVRALGGDARLRTAPGEGTEWEITVPRRTP